ncbi:ribosome maturation factor RimM [Pseudoxanthomonas winnipegensis]|uniref:Ribosome maturation factor RimM n=1 Tax=Pseudoxanthomonas winnipegensis TaxID=2480810 RepID=A0A4Q8LXV1_9GAMM|nr:ribosome maturation factor RimM [Pseudoxanthomonas winnipegensis]RZZ90742.1 ribosome maturation factor RimM [Pseudoxanthomonas winnipegensis]TAA36148.1 ribosome maturation factor RimM [Pseudoxanthomonas winnipegensis]
MSENTTRRILLGRVVGAFGVRGQVKIESWTEPREAIFRYQPWTLRDAAGRERELSGVRGKPSGKHLIASFPGVEDRDAVEAMVGLEIAVPRSALPPPQPDEYYWVDLEGLRVINADGRDFGTVSHLFSTGANDVLVARGDKDRLIPFIQPDFVTRVDFEAGVVGVDWDPEF